MDTEVTEIEVQINCDENVILLPPPLSEPDKSSEPDQSDPVTLSSVTSDETVDPAAETPEDAETANKYPEIPWVYCSLGLCFERKFKRPDWALDCYRMSHKKGFNIGTYNYGQFLSVVVRKDLKRTLDCLKIDLKDKTFMRDTVGFTAPGTGFDEELEQLELEIEQAVAEINRVDKKTLKLFLKYTQTVPTDAGGWVELGLAYFNLYEMDPQNVEYLQRKIDAYEQAFDLGRIKLAVVIMEYYGPARHSELGIEKCKSVSNRIAEVVYNSIVEDFKQKRPQKISIGHISKLALMYATRNGMFSADVNEDRSFELSLIAADLGSVGSKYNVGMGYYNGQGVRHDTAKAYEYFLESAELGDCDGMYEVGLFLEYGLGGVPVDLEKAKEWYKKAAKCSQQDSCFKLLDWATSDAEKLKTIAEEFRNPETQTVLLLKALRVMKNKNTWTTTKVCPKSFKVPIGALFCLLDTIDNDVPKLKQKIIELECRPPEDGGAVYRCAEKDYYDE